MARRIRSMLAWVMIVAMTVGSGTLTAVAQESTPAAPSVDSEQLFDVAGVDAPILAQAPIADATDIDGAILLERIELPAASEMAPRTIASSELYYVQSGTLSIQDDFGFGTAIPAGGGLALNAGTSFTAANPGSETATVLRLRLSQGEGAAGEATPVDLTAGSASQGDDIQPVVLVQMPVSGLSIDTGQLFLSRATFSPGAETGEQGHAGPIGLYVETGTLNVVSPSGFQGTIATGQGVSLPAETPLQASVVDSEAVVLIVGIGAAEGPFAEVTPEPEPTPTPEPTTEAEPTQAPTPETTQVAAGTVLYEANTASGGFEEWSVSGGWRLFNGMLVSDGTSGTSLMAPVTLPANQEYAIEAEIQVFQRTNRNVGFRLVAYDGEVWGYLNNYSGGTVGISLLGANDALATNRYDPGTDWHTYRFEVEGNQARVLVDGAVEVEALDNRLLSLEQGQVGLYAGENWQFNVRSFRVIALGDASVASDQSVGSSAQANAAPAGGGSQAVTLNIQDSVASLGPPFGLMVVEQGALDAAAITASFSDPAAARTFFDDWGWQENAFAYYEPPNGGSSDSGLVYIDIGLHRFANADGASQALDYFANIRRDQMSLADTAVDQLGEQSRAIMGQTSMGTEASVYSRAGTVVIRVSVMSIATDPLGVAVEVTRSLFGVPQRAQIDLPSLLPAHAEVPQHLVLAGEANRSLAEVAANYTDPARITAMFEGWGWQGNVTRAFQMPDGVYPEQTQVNGIYVSIHAFGTPQDAVAALDYSLTDQASSTGAWEVASPGLGDYSRALMGQMSYGNEVTLLVQRNNLLIRLSVAQLEGDPTAAATGIMQGILGRTG